MPNGAASFTAYVRAATRAMIDVVKDFRERFDFSAYMILSAWEYEPDGMIDERTIRDFTESERTCLAIFEKRYAALGPIRYEEAMIVNVQAIGCQTRPQDATDDV